MNPIIFLFVLGAASAGPLTSIETGLGERFPIVYEYPRDNIVLGNVVHHAVHDKTPVETVYQNREQARPFYVREIPYNQYQGLDRPVQKIVLNRQYQNEDDFPIYTPSGHIVHHGTPKPRPQTPTHEEEKEHHVAPVRSLYPGLANREVVYIYRPQREQFREIGLRAPY